jgi:uncharacterized membrane protein
VSRRQLIALLAVVGACVATYLTLYKIGIIGTLSCSIGSCEQVNTSRWSRLLGAPVALWGVGFYLTVLTVAIAGTLPRFSDSRAIATSLLALGTGGLLFSIYLTSLELFVIHAICMWCVISAIIATTIFALSAMPALSSAPVPPTPR